MDQLEHVDDFNSLVARINKALATMPVDKKKANMRRNDDTIIAARVRPLLEDEIENGQVEGSIVRSDGLVDLHAMALGLPGGPKLRVC